jgi:hypothetical protein
MSDNENIFLTLLYWEGTRYGVKLFFETYAKNKISDFLLFLFKITNLPSNIQIKLGVNSSTDRYFGLVELHFSSKMTLVQVKQCLYEVYCVCKAEGLTVKGKNTILVSNSFSDSSVASASVFFDRSEEKWLDGFKIQPYGKILPSTYPENFLESEKTYFDELISSFQSVCISRISGSQAYLFLICSGVILGGSFDFEVLNDCILTASKMTLENEKLLGFSQTKKARLFLQIVKFLFCEEPKRRIFALDFQDNFNLESDSNFNATAFDMKKFTSHELNSYYNFGVNYNE